MSLVLDSVSNHSNNAGVYSWNHTNAGDVLLVGLLTLAGTLVPMMVYQ
jgi:hypothetical protein